MIGCKGTANTASIKPVKVYDLQKQEGSVYIVPRGSKVAEKEPIQSEDLLSPENIAKAKAAADKARQMALDAKRRSELAAPTDYNELKRIQRESELRFFAGLFSFAIFHVFSLILLFKSNLFKNFLR